MEFDEEITPSRSSLKIGPFELIFLPQSIQQSIKVKFKLGVDDSLCPDGHVRASVTLECIPTIKFRKAVHIRIPTWFSSKADVDVIAFVLQDDMSWMEVETTALTDESFIDVHVKQLSNIAAFLSKKHLLDVSLQVKPFLFHNSGGSFKVGSIPSDEVVWEVLSAEMKEKNHFPNIKDVKALSVSVGDEISYNLSDQKGKVIIDEGFLQGFIGQAATYDLKASPTEDSFDLQHARVENGRREVIHSDEYPVIFQQNQAPDVSSVEFLGNFEADNVINNAGDVYIDQTKKVDESGKESSSRNEVRYEWASTANQTPPNPALRIPAFVMNSSGSRSTTSNMKFFGNVKVKNVIGNAGTVTIDQRRVQSKPNAKNRSERNNNSTASFVTQAQGDVSTEAGVQNTRNDGRYDIDIAVKNDVEAMVGSDRTFT